MRKTLLFGAALFSVVLTSCASTNTPKMATMLRDTTGQNGRACILQSDIKSYGVLKDNIISINGKRKYYLATVLPGCNDLQTSVRAMFSGKFSEICGQSMDKLVTGGNQCTINHIFQFNSRDEAFAVYNSILEQRESMKDAAGSGSY